MKLAFNSSKNLAPFEEIKWQKLFGESVFIEEFSNEQIALNVLFNALMRSNDRFLIISGATITLNSKFRWILNHYSGKYLTVDFLDPDFAEIKSVVKNYCPQFIVYDFLNIAPKPNWNYWHHLTRINGSKLIISLGEGINSNFIQECSLISHADFLTAFWGMGLIVTSPQNRNVIKDSKRDFLGKDNLVKPNWVTPKTAVANFKYLLEEIDSSFIYGKKGSYALFGFQETAQRVENFQQILKQIGIELLQVPLKNKKLSFLELSSFKLTQQEYSINSFTKLGKIIMMAFYYQKDIIKLEDLHQEVLNIYRDHLESQ